MSDKKICLVGLGYVGLPLAVAFAEKFKVIGFDINSLRIQELKDGRDRTLEIDDTLLVSVKSNIEYTSNIQDTKDCNVYIVTVPTPIDSTNRPDLTPLIEASKTVGMVLNEDDIEDILINIYNGNYFNVNQICDIYIIAKNTLTNILIGENWGNVTSLIIKI